MASRCGWALTTLATWAVVVASAPAHAATSVVAYAPRAEIGPVLLGDSVVWGEERAAFSRSGSFRLRAANATGATRTVLSRPDSNGARPHWTRLLGSAGGLAFSYDVVRDSRDPVEEPEIRTRTTGALTVAGVRRNIHGTPLQFSATTLLVDRSDGAPTRLALVDVSGATPDVDVTPAKLDPRALPGVEDARVAGDFLAIAEEVPGADDLNNDTLLTLFRRSTGARVYSLAKEAIAAWTIADLAADGRLLVAEQLGAVVAGTRYRLHVLDPVSAPVPRLVAALVTSGAATIVGDAAIAPGPSGGRGARPTAFPLAGGAPRPLGAPATAIADLAATADTVTWRTDDGCVLRAPLAAPADSALPAGPCRRAALTFPPQQGLRANSRRVLRIAVGCPGAPPPGCRGTVVLRLLASRAGRAVRLASARVAVPANATSNVSLRLSRAANRIVARRGGDAQLRATIGDPEGRKRTTSLDFFLEVPGTPPVPPIGPARASS